MPEPIEVRVRDCACPDVPHADEGDLVYLHPTLSLLGGLAAQRDWQASITGEGDKRSLDGDALTDRWMVTFVRFGFAGSNCGLTVDDVLADFTVAEPVADKASDLYQEAVLRPLGMSRSQTSPDGPTGDSTSAAPRRTRSPRS
jgi:hypothetical protein